MSFRILILISLFIITGTTHCKKDTEETLSGTYQTNTTATLGKPTLYTKNWQTQDSNFIKSYLQRLSLPQYFNFSASMEAFPEQLKISFLQTNTVRIEMLVPGYPAFVRNGIFTELPGYGILLDPKDTSLYYFSLDSCGYYQKKANLYQLNYSCYPGGPFTEKCYSSYYFPARNDKGQLFLPLYSSVITCGNLPGNLCSSGRSNVKNVFDQSLFTGLKNNDTIVLQTKEVSFQKQ